MADARRGATAAAAAAPQQAATEPALSTIVMVKHTALPVEKRGQLRYRLHSGADTGAFKQQHHLLRHVSFRVLKQGYDRAAVKILPAPNARPMLKGATKRHWSVDEVLQLTDDVGVPALSREGKRRTKSTRLPCRDTVVWWYRLGCHGGLPCCLPGNTGACQFSALFYATPTLVVVAIGDKVILLRAALVH